MKRSFNRKQLMPKVYREIDFDSVEASEKASRILRNKKCLRDVYTEIYTAIRKLRSSFLLNNGKALELGSGGGFIKDLFPEVITSDLKRINGIDMIVNAEKIPFANDSLDAIIAVHVIHHIPDITKFLKEANRVLKLGGGIICVEPYWSFFARFIYSEMHPEPFNTKTTKWQLNSNNPMTSSNQAISYLLLKRDKKMFDVMFPEFKVVYRKSFGLIRYLMTGGIWLKQKLPNFMFPVLKGLESLLTPLMPLIALHHIFVWKKIK